MPVTEVLFYEEGDGSVPVLEWLDDQPAQVQDKVIVRVERLRECGHELRRPEAAFLRDGIYELRVRHMRVNYRLLYFFHEGLAVLSDGIVKVDAVGKSDIDRSIDRLVRYAKDPTKHTHRDQD